MKERENIDNSPEFWRNVDPDPAENCDHPWAIYDSIYWMHILEMEREKYEKAALSPLYLMDLVDEDGEYFLI